MKRLIFGCLALIISAGCTEASQDGESYTKSQAALMNGKGDSGEDICDLMNWYGDGECDTFCPRADEDCAWACASDGECAVGQACVSGACEDASPAGCSNDGECAVGQACVSGACEDGSPAGCSNDGECAVGQVCVSGACTMATTADCGGFAGLVCDPTEFCEYAAGAMCGAADQLGTCATRPDFCTAQYDPVCGCDNTTYSNACQASVAGTSVFSDGPCAVACSADSECLAGETCVSGTCETSPSSTCTSDNDCAASEACIAGTCTITGQNCGGFAGLVCAQDEFCYYAPTEMCGAADQFGTCAPKPTTCSTVADPVCGCDALVYKNACSAALAGVSVTRCNP